MGPSACFHRVQRKPKIRESYAHCAGKALEAECLCITKNKPSEAAQGTQGHVLSSCETSEHREVIGKKLPQRGGDGGCLGSL